jgi:hypothetical protein
MEKLIVAVGTMVLFVILALVFGILLAFPLMWLWNYVMPYLFGLREIDLWHAWAINVLTAFLFKSSHSSK